jgi:ABC-type sugar transport system permease subunit
MAFPILYAAYGSLLHNNLLDQDSSFAGIANYVSVFGSPTFWPAVEKSLIFVAGVTGLGIVLATIFAFALQHAARRLRFLRGMTIIPYIVSGVAVAIMFRIFFNTDFGLPNQILGAFGIGPVSWLADPTLAMVTVILAQIWGDLPLPIIVILGGLLTVDSDLLDAALVDGASGWQRARSVTLPLIAPQLAISLVFLCFTSVTTLGVILALTGGGPITATQTLPLEMYRLAFEEFDMGQAMAVAIVLFILNACVAAVVLRVQRRYAI